MLATSEPWPVSVIAKQPGISRLMMPGSHFSWCSSVPRWFTAEPKRPHWTPALICSEGSAMTSSWKPATLAPCSSAPPTAAGKARCTAPLSTRIFSWPKARLRCSVWVSPSVLCSSGRPASSRAVRRTSAHLPSSCSPRAATSTAGVPAAWVPVAWAVLGAGAAGVGWPAGRSASSVMSIPSLALTLWSGSGGLVTGGAGPVSGYGAGGSWSSGAMPKQSQSVIWRAMASWPGLAGESGLASHCSPALRTSPIAALGQ